MKQKFIHILTDIQFLWIAKYHKSAIILYMIKEKVISWT